jgi:DedD protein
MNRLPLDRRVKERLVGATILVALIVVIVPELLSGPRPPSALPLEAGLPAATRNVSVDLATSKATPEPKDPGARSAPRLTDAAAGGHAGAAGNAAAAGAAVPPQGMPDSAPMVATLRAQGPPGELETPSSSPRSAPEAAVAPGVHHAWAVQLGSFHSKANADKLAHQLQMQGGASIYVISSGSGTSMQYRVRMGPLGDRGAAERAVAKLKAEGHAATIVTPAS